MAFTWEQYRINKEKYGHVATRCLYDDHVYDEAMSPQREYDLRKALFLAENEEEFEQKNLSVKLNPSVIVLG